MAGQTIEERLEELKEKRDHVGDLFGAADLQTLVEAIEYSMSHGGEVSVAVTPMENGYKITVISEGVTQEATVQNGGDAYEVYKSTVPSGQTPMSKDEWLASLKGADGADGQDGQDGAPGADAVNPFKGYYPIGVSKPATGAVGDYLYAPPSDQTLSASATIWHYDANQTPPWTDTGIDVSAVVAVELGSGQSVPATKIMDENGDEVSGAANVLSAEAGKELNVNKSEATYVLQDIGDYESLDFIIAASDPTYWGRNRNKKHIRIPLGEEKCVKVTAQTNAVAYIAWLASNEEVTPAGVVPYVENTSLITIQAGDIGVFVVPDAALYLYISKGADDEYTPQEVSFEYVGVSANANSASPHTAFSSFNGKQLKDRVQEIEQAIKAPMYVDVESEAVYAAQTIDATGELIEARFGDTKEYDISTLSGSFFASGYAPSASSGNLAIAFYGARGFISGINPAYRSAFVDVLLEVPNGATSVRIFGREGDNINTTYTSPAKLVNKTVGDTYDFENMAHDIASKPNYSDLVPQIFETPIRRRGLSEPLRVLCFGSSWFRNTWWYLAKIINSAGISAEIHCYYIAHSQFVEWTQLYNNDLTPFTGEPTRQASKHVSVNGADWTITNYSASGAYNAQSYRDDFYNDMVAGDWDVIGFQQGARQAPYWDLYWRDYWKDVIKMVRENCGIDTVMAFNSTWVPAVQDAAELSPWPATEEGQHGWQEANWENTKKFMALSGLRNVAPNGKLMALLRDSELNDSEDLAHDGLHPNNGLPIYALCACFYEAFFAQMYGISIDSVSWIPTSTSQRAGSYPYTEIDSTQAAEIKRMVKKAFADRFAY